jgi:hypothetical protein
MRERQEADDAISRDGQGCVQGTLPGHDRTVRPLRALRRTGGTGREDQCGDVVLAYGTPGGFKVEVGRCRRFETAEGEGAIGLGVGDDYVANLVTEFPGSCPHPLQKRTLRDHNR